MTYAVRERVDGGQISVGLEPPPADGTERVMLLSGTRPGEYHLEATRTADGTLLTIRRFRVTALWPDEEPERIVHTVGVVANARCRVLLNFETLQYLAEGRRVWFVLGRPGDNALAEAVTEPRLFE